MSAAEAQQVTWEKAAEKVCAGLSINDLVLRMAAINFYFHVHQPWRLRRYDVFDVGSDHNYFDVDYDNDLNRKVIEKSVHISVICQ